jgi:hypothetical protein
VYAYNKTRVTLYTQQIYADDLNNLVSDAGQALVAAVTDSGLVGCAAPVLAATAAALPPLRLSPEVERQRAQYLYEVGGSGAGCL